MRVPRYNPLVPKFSEMFIQQVAQATDIVDLVSQYVALKKSGREFVGLCPFHQDHKPSMTVAPAKQIFKCFSCGAGGGVFQFVMLYDKLNFPEAVKSLAERAHIPLPREAGDDRPRTLGLEKDDLHRVMGWAADFFHEQLLMPAGGGAMQYATGRGLTPEAIERFKLGFAPISWDAMLKAAARDGVAQSQLLACGLIIQRDGNDPQGQQRSGCYDRFRNRLMFPIYDVAGHVIAFGGRALAADEKAKYLNSPETALFQKSDQLFAMNWSREGISKSGTAVVVEGYMDAIIPLQAGVDNVVATLGTALTERHVKILSRYAREVVLIFDADAAGVKAAQRGLEIFLAQQVHVRVASIPDGKDPCDYTLAHGADAMRELIAKAPDALEYVWARRWADYQAGGGNLADRRKVVEEFLQLVVSSAAYGSIDEVRRGQLAQHIGHILNISPSDLQAQMRRQARTIPRASLPAGDPTRGPMTPQEVAARNGGARVAITTPRSSGDVLDPQERAQRNILEVLLCCPDLFDAAAERIGPDDFTDPAYRHVALGIWQLGTAGRLSLDELLPLESMAEAGALLADLATEAERRGNYHETLAGAMEHLEYNRQRMAAQSLKAGGLTDEALLRITQAGQRPDARRVPKIS